MRACSLNHSNPNAHPTCLFQLAMKNKKGARRQRDSRLQALQQAGPQSHLQHSSSSSRNNSSSSSNKPDRMWTRACTTQRMARRRLAHPLSSTHISSTTRHQPDQVHPNKISSKCLSLSSSGSLQSEFPVLLHVCVCVRMCACVCVCVRAQKQCIQRCLKLAPIPLLPPASPYVVFGVADDRSVHTAPHRTQTQHHHPRNTSASTDNNNSSSSSSRTTGMSRVRVTGAFSLMLTASLHRPHHVQHRVAPRAAAGTAGGARRSGRMQRRLSGRLQRRSGETTP